MLKKLGLIVGLSACSVINVQAQQENLGVLNYWHYHKQYTPLLYTKLMNKAEQQLGARQTKVDALQSASQWKSYQSEVQNLLQKLVGDLPAKSDLKVQVTGKVVKDGVMVEKLIYQSIPDYWVTAAVFKPEKAAGKLPTIVFCSGHAANGFRSDAYQRMILNYVKKGFLVLAFDPIGQGERVQYFKDGKSQFSPTHEHSYPGSQAFLAGISPAKYFIWDGIRAIDYLLTRPDVDGKRIGITGRSGGGTQSAYIAAVDDRIVAAAPECYLTTFDKLLRSKGPQDAEQNFIGSIAAGFDIPDLVIARAPKPTLMVTTTNDIFSIAGAREMFAQVSKAYRALGKSEQMQMVEDDAGHESTLKNREATYAFFQKYLNNPGSKVDEAVTYFTEQELWATPEGNIYAFNKGKSLYDLVQQEVNTIKRKDLVGEELRNTVQRHINYSRPSAPKEALFSGRVVRKSHTIEKYILQTADKSILPVLWLKPLTTSQGTILWVDAEGKAKAAVNEGLVGQLCEAGYEVVLPDISGTGELSQVTIEGGDALIEGTSLNLWYLAGMTNNSIAAYQMADLYTIASWVKNTTANKKIIGVGKGAVATPLLQLHYLEKTLLEKVLTIEGLSSFTSILQTKNYRPNLITSGTMGVVKAYDLPDLVKAMPQNSVYQFNSVAGDGTPMTATASTLNVSDLLQVLRK